MNILIDPVDCLYCNQTFCKDCINNYLKTNKNCPFDNFVKQKNDENNIKIEKNSEKNLKPSSNNINKLIDSLRLFCSYKNNGCNMELCLKEINEHEEKCRFKNRKIMTSCIINNNSHSKNEKIKNFKKEDSCISFSNVDLSKIDNNNFDFDNNNNNKNVNEIVNNNNVILNDIAGKIDFIYEKIKNINNNNNENFDIKNDIIQNFKNNLPKKNESSKKISYKSPESNNINLNNEILKINKEEKVSTPKLGSHKKNISLYNNVPKINISNYLSQFNNNNNNNNNINLQSERIKKENNNYLKILSEINSLGKKIRTLEKLSQANYSIENQGFLIQTEEDSKFSNSTFYNTLTNSNSSYDINNIKNKFKFCSEKKPSMKFKKLNSYFSISNLNKKKIISSKNNNNNKINENFIEMIKKEIKENFDNFEKFIDEKCVEELKKFFMDYSLDNTNLFVEKLDEVQEIIKNNLNRQK